MPDHDAEFAAFEARERGDVGGLADAVFEDVDDALFSGDGVDAVMLPAIPFPIPTIEETDTETKGGPAVLKMVAGFTGLTRPFNTLGLPALSVPCGFDSNGAPIGLQLIGRPFDEALLYRVGHAYQGATDFHRKVPA